MSTRVPMGSATASEGRMNVNTEVSELLEDGRIPVAALFAASELHLGSISSHLRMVNVTPTMDAGLHVIGDTLIASALIPSAFRVTDGLGILQALTIIDKDSLGLAFTLYFLDTSTPIGVNNSAPNISDVNAEGVLGQLSIVAGDFSILSGVKIATFRNLGLPVKAVGGTDDFYLAAVTLATPTPSANGMVFRLGIEQRT